MGEHCRRLQLRGEAQGIGVCSLPCSGAPCGDDAVVVTAMAGADAQMLCLSAFVQGACQLLLGSVQQSIQLLKQAEAVG